MKGDRNRSDPSGARGGGAAIIPVAFREIPTLSDLVDRTEDTGYVDDARGKRTGA